MFVSVNLQAKSEVPMALPVPEKMIGALNGHRNGGDRPHRRCVTSLLRGIGFDRLAQRLVSFIVQWVSARVHAKRVPFPWGFGHPASRRFLGFA